MIFSFFHYKVICLLLFFIFIFILCTRFFLQCAWIFSLLSGIFSIGLVLCGFYYAIPLSELLLLFLLITLFCFRNISKGVSR